MHTLDNTRLMQFLQAQDAMYYGKALELAEVVAGWLSYVPQTFPHYTRHTIEHSVAIVQRLSDLLFDERNDIPVVPLSALEVYVLVAAALLHDAGMVASDQEKSEILSSALWLEWTSAGSGALRWKEVQALRERSAATNDPSVAFTADVQTRFLLSEFIRRSHHTRSGAIITQHESALARLAFNHPLLRATIADVCVAHGLDRQDLLDKDRFPERRDIRGHRINVRFMALLLRIGDLLDMDNDRACPLLLNAACPLPADSFAHWSQYQRISHFLVAPDEVQITAECESQEEHRYLHDWCQWLVDELHDATAMMARSARHSSWVPPKASTEGTAPTIKIHPSRTAAYVPSRWVFELDHTAVFERLIRDAYDQPHAFIRELLQNAIDATRCQLYATLRGRGDIPPEIPADVDEGERAHFQISVTLSTDSIANELSGSHEEYQVLTIEDTGVGMDREVIERYLLQVGRSFYTTDAFRRKYGFLPTSRFGIGFLSVFAVSDHVIVETYNPDSENGHGPLRLVLTGPRQYILTERSTRRTRGTTVRVRLREPLTTSLTQLVREWCKRVEFAITVDDLGLKSSISHETPTDFTYEIPDVTSPEHTLAVKAFPLKHGSIAGELYVFTRTKGEWESWTDLGWAQSTYPTQSPLAKPVSFPDPLVALHGIAVSTPPAGWHIYGGPARNGITRIDVRRALGKVSLARNYVALTDGEQHIINSRWAELLRDHMDTTAFARTKGGWAYKQGLMGTFPVDHFWGSVPGTIRVFDNSRELFLSLEQACSQKSVTVAMRGNPGASHNRIGRRDEKLRDWHPDTSMCVITEFDLSRFCEEARRLLFLDRVPVRVELFEGWHSVTWMRDSTDRGAFLTSHDYSSTTAFLSAFPVNSCLAIRTHPMSDEYQDIVLINQDHPFTLWLLSITKDETLTDSARRILTALSEAALYPALPNAKETLRRYLSGWDTTHIPGTTAPPVVEWNDDSLFEMRPVAC